jgi:hypothetical protein
MIPLFFILYITFIHSILFIQCIHPSTLTEVSFYLLFAGQLSGKIIQSRIELWPAVKQADALPMSHAAPCLFMLTCIEAVYWWALNLPSLIY